jgi:hypothetical protein
VEDINGVSEFYGVKEAIRAARIVFDQFENVAHGTMKRLGILGCLAELHEIQCVTELVLDVAGKRFEIGERGGDPFNRLEAHRVTL